MADITLKSVDYQELVGRPLEWSIRGLNLGPVNLIVGKNASGKTRALNVIATLAALLRHTRESIISDCAYDVQFEAKQTGFTQIRLELRIVDFHVIHERVTVDDQLCLDRSNDGVAKVWSAEQRLMMSYRPPSRELFCTRKDEIQHPFLIPLFDWATSVRHYHFGSLLGKDKLSIDMEKSPHPARDPDDRDENGVVAIYNRAKFEFSDRFDQAVLDDMLELGYEVSRLQITHPRSERSDQDSPVSRSGAVGLREQGIGGVVSQLQMSQGMFRALSILIQVNYSQMSKRANCILIDDIGEGLDFQRSTGLIKVLRRKAMESQFQLIMTTNDQFVMNHVPLEEWSLLHREGCRVDVKNNTNSHERFEEFKFLGMSNFTFFELDFANESPDDEFPVDESTVSR